MKNLHFFSSSFAVTTCSQAEVALTLLREKKGFFDLVLSDVHMPGMNGYKLLQQVGIEMDLPVISKKISVMIVSKIESFCSLHFLCLLLVMSVDGRPTTVMTGINHGACDYLIKPIRPEELKNIWQHVVRKKWTLMNKEIRRNSQALEDNNKNSSSSLETAVSVSECSEGSLKLRKKKKKKRSVDRDDNEDDDDLLDPGNNSKKSRVVWSIELHQQFVNAVNQLGIDSMILITIAYIRSNVIAKFVLLRNVSYIVSEAVPKRILELMNAPGLSRENVASHLQVCLID